jgi:hypothetical protein
MYFNSAAWHVQHTLQHHIYTNDELDVDLYHFQPIMRITRLSKFNWIHNLQWLLVWLVLPTAVGHLTLVVPMDLLTGQIDAITGTKRYQECENVEDFVAGERAWIAGELALSSTFLLWNIWLHGFSQGFSLEGLACVALAYTMSSIIFMIFSQGAHIQEECQKPVVQSVERSWAKNQVDCALVFQPRSKFWAIVSGGLNMQALHHILPGISASHLCDLYPRFLSVCKKHGVEVKEVSGVGPFFGGFTQWVTKLAQDLDITLEGDGKTVSKTGLLEMK